MRSIILILFVLFLGKLSFAQVIKIDNWDDAKEFQNLKVIGIADSSNKKFKNLTEYLNFRKTIFGSNQKYKKSLDSSFKQINSKELQNYLNSHMEKFKNYSNKDERLLYCGYSLFTWTRRGLNYEGFKDLKSLIISEGFEQSKPIRAKMISNLQSIANSIKTTLTIHEGAIRPKKVGDSYSYNLGTYSDHGFGFAIDINENSTATISSEVWNKIVEISKVQFDRFIEYPINNDEAKLRNYFDKLIEVQNNFINNYIINEENYREVNSSISDKNLLSTLKGFKSKYENTRTPIKTFFNIPFEVIKALLDENWVWGITFNKQADLHHFQFPDRITKEIKDKNQH